MPNHNSDKENDPNQKSRFRSGLSYAQNLVRYAVGFFQKKTTSDPAPIIQSTEVSPDTITAWNIVTSLNTIIFAKENRPSIMAASVLTTINTILNFVTPYLLGETIEAFNIQERLREENTNPQEIDMTTPLILSMVLVGSYTLSQMIPNFRDQLLAPIEVHSRRKIFGMIADHQLQKSLDYQSKTSLDKQLYLVEKAYSSSTAVTPILTQITPTIFEIIMAVTVLSNRFGMGMGAGIIGTGAIYTAFTTMTTQSIMDTRKVMMNASMKSSEKIMSALKQYKTIHDFLKSSYAMKDLEEALQATAKAEINMISAPMKIGQGQIAIPRIGMLFATLYVGVGVLSGNYSTQELLLVMSYLDKLSSLVPSVGRALNTLFAAVPDFKVLFGELNKPSEIYDPFPDVHLKIKQKSPSIRFENVTFTYPQSAGEPEKPLILDNLSFSVESGQTAAFVSESGGGKSSIFKLLYRYNSPDEGRIYIDDQDISQVSMHSLQSNIALIAQGANLLNTSIRDNIRYGAKNPDEISDEKIWEVARAANLFEFLDSFPEKLDSPVGEDGNLLSGGQKQRVGILRGLFKESPIRLFDEITSALDSNTSADILAGIEKLTAGQTRLVITHKLSEAQSADKIFVLDKGTIVAEGKHSELLKSCDLYKSLWEKQNKDSDVDEPKIDERVNTSVLKR